jgi:hypothetical protein
VAALHGEVFDVGAARLGDAQPVEAEEHSQRSMRAVEAFGGKQERAEFGAVHAGDVVGGDLGAPQVLGGFDATRLSMWAKR